jgi:hypothetical protein
MPTSEELARTNIDKQLETGGWTVQAHSMIFAGINR